MLLIENNTLTGDVDAICSGSASNLLEFVADCGGSSPEIECPTTCCTTCCRDGQVCLDEDLLATFDPVWEKSYQRMNYYDFGGNYTFG